MQIIERKNIDVVKWDALVNSSASNVFSLSSYLDATAEQWSILVNEDYSAGMSLPYLQRYGQKLLYTPIFYRYSEQINFELSEQEIALLKAEFNFAALLIDKIDPESGFLFQEIEGEATVNERAKRMIKKFNKSGLTISSTVDEMAVWQIINDTLTKKVDSLNEKAMKSLQVLLENLKKEGILKILAVLDGDQVVGGAFFVERDGRILYLKSAFYEEAKKAGAMYKIIALQIENSIETNRTFDFGGSRAENVRNFNLNFGAKDVHYAVLKWNKLPFWLKLGMKLKGR